MILHQVKLPARAIVLRMARAHRQRVAVDAGVERYIRRQHHDPGLRVKTGAGRAAGRLRQVELDLFRGVGHPGFLIEDQPGGSYVYRVFPAALLGRSSRRTLEIDLHLSGSAGNAVHRIPVKRTAVDTIGRVSLGAVQSDAYVVQLGVAAVFKLHRLGSMQGVDGVSAA